MQIATGTQDFTELVKSSDKIVDKTLLIKEIIEDRAKVILITAPRRWGKSINMSMLKAFLEKKVDKDGNPIDREKTDEYMVFYGGEVGIGFGDRKNLEKLEIFSDQKVNEGVKKRQGQYPVIYLDFKDCKGNSYEEAENNVREKICKAFQEHDYLKNSNKLKPYQKEQIQKFINRGPSLTITDINDGIRFLSECLKEDHGQRAWILIDEYDAPINNMYFEDASIKNPEERDKVIKLFKGILSSALKGNDTNLEKGILTGILRVAKGSSLSGLNNIEERSFADAKYTGLYGFTQKNVNDLFTSYRVEDEGLRKKFEEHYNGYSTQKKGVKIYNPWSVLKALKQFSELPNPIHDQVLKQYWDESGSSHFIANFLRHLIIAKDINKLIKGKSIQFTEVAPFEKSNLEELERLVNNKENNLIITQNTRNLLFTYLKLTGYLDKDQSNNSVKIPNEEIKINFKSKLESYYEEVFPRITSYQKNQLISTLNEFFDNPSQAEKNLEVLLSNIFQTTDEKTKLNEDLIHSLFNYIAYNNSALGYLYMGSEYIVDGSGKRADTVFLKENQGVIVELKYKKSAREALDQIQKNEYHKAFEEYNKKQSNKISQVIPVGINLKDNKQVEVKVGTLISLEMD